MAIQKGWSYSSYSALRKCGQYYKLNYIDGEKQDPNVNLEFGSAMHKGMFVLLTSRDLSLAQDAFSSYWEGVKWLSIEYQRHSWDQLSEMGLKFLNTFSKKYLPEMELIEAETRCYTPRDGIEYEGTPDAIVKWRDQIVLLDYKTSAYNYHPRKGDISLQMNLYSDLYTSKSQVKVGATCYIVFNKGTGTIQTPVILPIDHERKESMISEMSDYILANKSRFTKNPNSCIMGSMVCDNFNKCWGEK